MRSHRLLSRLSLVLLGAALATPILAVRRAEDALALVPAGAATVGVLHCDALRASPLAAPVLAQWDHVSSDGDAARFLAEAQLDPRRDVDTIVVATVPAAAAAGNGALVFFEGRFDVDKITSALTGRGAEKQSASGSDYYRLPAGSANETHHGAVAFLNRGLAVAGDEDSVVGVLARRESGGAGGLMAGDPLAQLLPRVSSDATAWALVDLKRMPAARHAGDAPQSGDSSSPANALMGAMKNVSAAVLQATVKGTDVTLSASGLSADAETRGLLQDSLKGVLAMWRLAVQDKNPDLVPVIRNFQVEDDGQAVSIRGTLPGSFLKKLTSESKRAAK
jgi:hypothetical protein